MSSNPKQLIIITAPSGAGKTSITHFLLGAFPRLAFSISATSRPPRSGEKPGVDYYFISTEAFKEKIQHHEFAEWEMVYEGKYYGTLYSELERIWANNQLPVLDIDVKGAIHLQQQYPGRSLTLFVQPPSLEELKRRLEARGTESPESLQARVDKASFELSFRDQFDYVVVNDELQRACREVSDILHKFILTNTL